MVLKQIFPPTWTRIARRGLRGNVRWLSWANFHKKMEEPDYIRAHKHSSNHREELLRSDVCGCFYCLEIYSPSEIMDWVDEDENDIGQCALCAKCGIDSVIGSASGYPVTKEFLKKMQLHWF